MVCAQAESQGVDITHDMVLGDRERLRLGTAALCLTDSVELMVRLQQLLTIFLSSKSSFW